MELQSWNIRVVTANPSFHRTPLLTSGMSNTVKAWQALDPAVRKEYGEEYGQAALDASKQLMDLFCWNMYDALAEET